VRTFPSGGFLRTGGFETRSLASTAAPLVFGLGPATPNPTSGRATFEFTLADAGRARLELYDVRGRLVRRLVDGPLPAGVHAAAWDGTNVAGVRVSPGIYFYRLSAASGTRVERLVRL
jgi:flagellar hook assembly protein FlgD